MTELMVVVAILGITAVVAVTGFRSNPTGGAARKVASMMSTAYRVALGAGATSGICTARAHLKFSMNGGSFQVTVLRLKEEAGACVEETPYISAALLDDTVEIYGLAPQANTLPGASVSLVSLSTPVDKSYNADGTADGFTVYLRHKYDDNATRYRIVGMPLSPAPLVFQDW